MNFIIEKNKETFYDTFVLHARPRNLEEQSMILSSKMQKFKQVQKGECTSGYATFGKKEGFILKIWESQFVNNFKKKSVRFFTKKKKELKKLNFEEILNSKKILDN